MSDINNQCSKDIDLSTIMEDYSSFTEPEIIIFQFELNDTESIIHCFNREDFYNILIKNNSTDVYINNKIYRFSSIIINILWMYSHNICNISNDSDINYCTFKKPVLQCSQFDISIDIDINIKSINDDCKSSLLNYMQNNVNCKSVCICSGGYGGKSCSFDQAILQGRASLRLLLCDALLNATQLSDPSPALLVSLAASLKQSYDPTEIVPGPAQTICSEALTKLSGFLASGYLKTAGTAAAQSISQTISLFIQRFP